MDPPPLSRWSVWFFVVLVTVLALFNLRKPRLLVLHSFAAADPWVRGVERGIDAALAASRRPLNLETFHMDSDLWSRPQARRQAEAAALLAIQRFRPDLIVAVDDEARDLLARSAGLPAKTRILPVSVLTPAPRGRNGALAAPGLQETLPLEPVADLLRQLWPDRSLRLAAIGVAIETGQAELAQVRRFPWGPHRLVAASLVRDEAEWRRTVRGLRDRADVLLVLSYFGLAPDPPEGGTDGSHAGPNPDRLGREIAGWTETHAGPLPIGLHVAYVADGGGLGLSPAPEVYGQEAVATALTWLDGRSSPPPARHLDPFDVAVRRSALARRGLRLPPLYGEAARAAGQLYP